MSRWLAVGLFLAGVSPALAQSGRYETRFDNANGWSVSGNPWGVGWNVDSTPSDMPGGAAHTATKSLNYNNGYNYSTWGSPNSAETNSPSINLAVLHKPTLTFWCNFQTEPGSESAEYPYDIREVTLMSDAGVRVKHRLGVTGAAAAIGACQAMGTWHVHKIDLPSEWKSVTVTFKFDTVSESNNGYKGWFIDDFTVDGHCDTDEVHTAVKVWNFDTATPLLDGWEVQNSDSYVRWNADPSPASAAGGGSYYSAPNSLNYNNGTNCKSTVYPNNGTGPVLAYPNNGTATSPPIDISKLACPRLVFQCNYHTRPVVWADVRTIQISNDEFAGSVYKAQFNGWGNQPLGVCSTPGTWHTHTIKLDPAWGTVRIRFKFDTVYAKIWNYDFDYAGWFLDDITVDAIQPAVEGWDEGDEEGPKTGDRGNKCGGSVVASVEPARLRLLGLALAMIAILVSVRRFR